MNCTEKEAAYRRSDVPHGCCILGNSGTSIFRVEDGRHLAAWSDDSASVVHKGYMAGWCKLDRRSGLFRIVDKTKMCQVIEIDF